MSCEYTSAAFESFDGYVEITVAGRQGEDNATSPHLDNFSGVDFALGAGKEDDPGDDSEDGSDERGDSGGEDDGEGGGGSSGGCFISTIWEGR